MPSSLLAHTIQPLTLSEQLEAMLSGWLDRHDPDGELGRSNGIARAVVTVADGDVAQVRAFCTNRALTVRRMPHDDAGRWAVLIVEGPELPVRGFTEITAMYRR